MKFVTKGKNHDSQYNRLSKIDEKNIILSAILAGVLLFPFITSSSSTTHESVIANYAYAQLSSNDDEDSYISAATTFDANSVRTIKKNNTQIANQDNNNNKITGMESTSKNTVFSSKKQFINGTDFLSNITNTTANIASVSNAAAQGSSPVTADFNGDGSDDLAIGVPYEDEGDSCTTNLPIAGVTASGNDGNVPQNVLDNSLSTRWSSLGVGQLITADLESVHKICSVDIAWYNGNVRQYHFVIATSTDGTTFTNRLSRDSNGTILSSEKYSIPPTNARYVRITVNGNTANNWASITELDIFGPSSSQVIFDSGAVNVIYGSSKGLSPTALSLSDGRSDQIWTQSITGGLEPSDGFGSALATGDFNKDGFSDLAIGVPREDIGTTVNDAGAVNVIYGSPTGLSSAGNQLWTQNSGGVHDGHAAPGDWFGYSLATGDFNKDGISDLAIGVPGEDVNTQSGLFTDAGMVNVIYGSLTGLTPDAGSDSWDQHKWNHIGQGDRFGTTITTGDFNKDGFFDLVIGAPRDDVGNDPSIVRDSGSVNVIYYGMTHDFVQTWSQDIADLGDRRENDDEFGSALATGDFNNDTISDLAIGILGEDIGNIRDAGAVNIVYGSTSGLQRIEFPPGNGRDAQLWTQDSPGIEDDAEDGDVFGDALATGDFNKDGFSDLAVGVPAEDVGTIEVAGAVNVIYGSSDGLSSSGSPGNGRDDQFWTQDSPGIEDDAEDIDIFGFTLVTGDFNKDTITDLAISVPLEDVGTIGNAGAVNVIYGSIRSNVPLGGLSAVVPPLGIGRADQIWTQDSPGIEDEAQVSDNFGEVLG
jgi:hypothetical protein